MKKYQTYLFIIVLFSFNIFAQSTITVLSPNGGESWQTGVEQTITWTDNITEDVKIDLYKGGVFDSELFASTFSDGSKFWTIPVGTTPDSDYTIKLTSVDSSNVFDFSDADFTIIASVITISTPNGGESWQAGTVLTITWADNITENVKIELFKGGSFHSVIVNSTDSDGIRNWTIPFLLESGSDYTVKITSVDNSNIFDFSDANFTIVGSQVTLTSPNGGEDWLIDSFQNITWNENLVSNVRIQLFKSGVFHSQITGGTVNDSLYIWNVPASLDPGSDYKIKILSVIDGSIFDFSDADFTLSHEIIVSSPNGGETWQAGSSQILTWTDNITDNVLIELYKGGSIHSVISSSTSSDGLKTWNIPFTLESGSDYKIKISSVVDPLVSDISDSNFTIVGNQVTVITPNSGEDWLIGSSQKITWIDNLNGNIEIQLYKGGVFHSTVTSSTASDGFYTWNISSSIESGADYKIRIASTVDGSIFDFSDADFTLSHQIVVTSPNGGEIWQAGTSPDIEWDDNINGNVKIELYKGGIFDLEITSSATSNGDFPWDVPITILEGSDYKIKVTSVDDSSVTDFSDANFTIFGGNVNVVSPNGSESWLAGSSEDITWSDNISGNVKIDLYKAGVFDSEIISSATSNGSFNWDIPDTIMEGSDYTIMISSVENTSVFDFSDADFTIFASNITLTSPNGGENWQAGSSQNVTWTDNINDNVTIDLYKGGSFHSVISTATSSDGSKGWTIPFTIESGSDYTVKITDVGNPSTFDFSDSNFIIIGNQITVTSPNGGEDWMEEGDNIITWTDNLTGNVEIQLFKAGIFHSQIVSSTASDGSYTWNISSSVESGADYKVQISSVSNGSIFDSSDEDFTIINNEIIVTSPNGGENWLTNISQEITWTDDISGDVKIELYKAELFDSEIAVATPSDGSFIWNIPVSVTTGSDYKIKISSVDQPILFNMSKANFTIFTGGIVVSSPNGGESWQAGGSQLITWADNITEDVTIDLYKGGVFHSVISTSTGSGGSRNWDIPFTLEQSTDYTVKITSVDNPSTIFDFSDTDFTIVGNQITLTTPNGGENWLNTESQLITWSDNLTGNVEIQLIKSGVFHSSIATKTPSDGEYTWDIPDNTPSASDFKVKIISVDDGNVFDLSANDFTIITNYLMVSAPNGGENWLTSISQNITWIDDISGDVKIELYKAEVFDTEITAATPSDGSFTWDIPDSVTTGSDYKIRITSVDQPVLFDMSDNNFTIFTGGITVSSPNGGESWQAGGSQLITWADNITEDVTIGLYQGGVFHSVISTSTTSNGSIDWNIPFDLEYSDDYSIKITSEANPSTIFDFSDSDFTIIANEITVTSPNGGENWQVESSQIITWMDNIVGNVEIQLFKAGIFLTSISTLAVSNGTMEWYIPFNLEPGSDYKVRILSLDNQGTFDYSDANFSIVGNQITLTSPNNAESWMIGTQQIISWIDNLVGNVEIQLFKGGVFHSQIDNSTSSDNSFIWNISYDIEPGSDYRIKILSANDGNIFDYSDEDFTLLSEIVVEVPNGAENWQAGTYQNISWADNINENIIIDLYKGGSFHSNISTSIPSDGTQQWNIPFNLESGTDYKIVITGADNPNIFDFSDSDFTIEGKLITITSPSQSEIWQAGTTQEIAWTENFSENVKIALYKGGLFHTEIDPSNSIDGSKFWEIPFVMDAGSDYSIKIKSVDDPNPFDSSADYYFNITANEITENSPNGGETWLIGSVQEITWTDNLEGDVEILLYKGGILHTIISSSTASDGFTTWTVPTIEQGNDFRIKILSVVTAEVFDQSDSNFTITSRIEINDILSGIPTTYELFQNFPNPFNPSTTIYYALPKEGSVELKIYDILGNEIMTFNEAEQSAGYHKIEFDAARLNSGVYIYRLQAGIFVETKKMILLR